MSHVIERLREVAYNPNFHHLSRDGPLVVIRVGSLRELLRTFDENIGAIHSINQRISKLDQSTLDLQAAVANETSVEQSAITLLGSLKTQLDAAIAAGKATGDFSAVESLSQQIGTNTDALAAAVAANTPAAATSDAVDTPQPVAAPTTP